MTEKEYWEERAIVTEQALERVMGVLGRHIPATVPELSDIAQEWNRIRRDLNRWRPERHQGIQD